MSLELCVLGSGSSGNSTVVRSAWGCFLLDAGFGPRVMAQRMHGIGLGVADISAIVLTHLDHDHFNWNLLQTIVKQGIRVYMARERVRDFLKSPEVRDLEMKLDAKRHAGPRMAELVVGFGEEEFEPVRGVRVSALHLAHDVEGSHGFVLECDGYKVGFATDLGHVPPQLLERFCGVDVLAIEANYDPEIERNSDRPWFLKQRVMGGKGHLSNEQALEAIRAIMDRTMAVCGPDKLPRHVVLLHRSRQCNCPKIMKKVFGADARIAGVVTFTEQYERTAWLSAGRPRAQVVTQLALEFALA